MRRMKLRRLTARLLLITLGVITAPLMAEAFLPLIGHSTGNFFRRDDVIGATHRPGAGGWWAREGRDYIRINSISKLFLAMSAVPAPPGELITDWLCPDYRSNYGRDRRT